MFNRLIRPSHTSRVLTRKLLPTLPSCNKVLNLGSVRFDSTTTANYEYFKKHMDDTNTAALKARDNGPVGQFGWLPFYGMLGVIAISKELVVCGTEFMLACSFGAWAFIAYVGLGHMATDTMTQALADHKTLFDKVTNWQVEKMRVYKAKTQVEVDTVPVLKEMLIQQRETEKAYLTAQNLEQRHALRQAILDKLNQIKVREDAEAALERSLFIDAAVAKVYKAFETDTGPLQNEAIVNAISILGTDGSTKLANDPVKKQFVKAFS